MNKKIITCAPVPPPNGGITNWFKILKKNASEKGYTLINIDISPKTATIERSIFSRIFHQGFFMIPLAFKLIKAVKSNPDAKVAHITTSGSLALIRDILFLMILKNRNVRSVYHLHFGRIPEIFRNGGTEAKLMKKALSLADSVITIDLHTYKAVLNCCEEKKVHYIPNPVELPYEASEVESKRVLFLGNVLKTKGIEELLTAWSAVCSSHTDWELYIAGSCNETYKNYLLDNFSFNNVKILGYLDHNNAMKVLSESSVLVLPSYTEGFPNVILEAMIRSKAVLATDVGAISDMLSDNCGLVVKPKDADGLASALDMLVKDRNLRHILAENAYNKAKHKYSADIVFKQYCDIWSIV